MKRTASRYPGDVPHATSINYDYPKPNKPTKFVAIGTMFMQTMEVGFWDGSNEIVAEVKEVTTSGSESQVTGQVQLPGKGMYQLILGNPNVPRHAQPCWIYDE